MAELVDAVDSKSTSSNRMLVRVRSSAKLTPKKPNSILDQFCPMKEVTCVTSEARSLVTGKMMPEIGVQKPKMREDEFFKAKASIYK